MVDGDRAADRSDKTFYDKMSSSWKNNKVIAISVFLVVVTIALLKVYTEITSFVAKVDPKKDRILEFNRLVQPIYFQERFSRLVDGQTDRIFQMIKDIKD